jgi:mono/diheme cytochrome c family protein
MYGCNNRGFSTDSYASSEPDPGKITYSKKCMSCHNRDPRKPGSVGPDVAGSSYELIEAKTQRREYPPGYTPKRKTKSMPKIKLTKKELEDLHKFLNSFEK